MMACPTTPLRSLPALLSADEQRAGPDAFPPPPAPPGSPDFQSVHMPQDGNGRVRPGCGIGGGAKSAEASRRRRLPLQCECA